MTTRTNPFEPLERMFERMSDQLRDAANSWESGDQFDLWMPERTSMRLDVVDQDDEYVVTVDVPGFDREDIEIRVDEDGLYLEAETEADVEETDEHYVRRERATRAMSRTVSFPTPIATDDVSATMEKGVLTISVAKAEPLEEGTPIEIEGE